MGKTIQNTTFSRARDFYLYTTDGRRIVDLDLGGGRGVLGHKPKGLETRIKQVLSRGLWHRAASVWERRFIKTLKRYFPQWHYMGLYCNLSAPLPRSHTEQNQDMCIPIWHPFAARQTLSLSQYSSVFITLPLLWQPPVFPLLYKADEDNLAQKEIAHTVLIGEDNLTEKRMQFSEVESSAVLYSALTFALDALVKNSILSESKKVCDFTERKTPKDIKKRNDLYAVVGTSEKIKNTAQLSLLENWKQEGIYIILPKVEVSHYSLIRETFFQYGFLFPEYQTALTLPHYFTKQELKNWESALTEIRKE